MRKISRFIGFVLIYGAGILQFIFWFSAMTRWLGLLGSVLAIVIAPGAIVFPFVFWIVEHVFPTMYFAFWGVGIIGFIILGLSSTKEE